ncbi:hypothetical protein V8G54_022038 [Vigna mungo]|uniref:Uncharacterized protein n=1 Tax=Vigna mungo TaxID=3915 RepID=A0AAQ3NH59_VIGMU
MFNFPKNNNIKDATGKSRRDDDDTKKETSFEKEIWSRHHSLFWKTTEKPKTIKQGPRKPDSGFGSRLRVGKVLAPYNACPEAKWNGGANRNGAVAQTSKSETLGVSFSSPHLRKQQPRSSPLNERLHGTHLCHDHASTPTGHHCINHDVVKNDARRQSHQDEVVDLRRVPFSTIIPPYTSLSGQANDADAGKTPMTATTEGVTATARCKGYLLSSPRNSPDSPPDAARAMALGSALIFFLLASTNCSFSTLDSSSRRHRSLAVTKATADTVAVVAVDTVTVVKLRVRVLMYEFLYFWIEQVLCDYVMGMERKNFGEEFVPERWRMAMGSVMEVESSKMDMWKVGSGRTERWSPLSESDCVIGIGVGSVWSENDGCVGDGIEGQKNGEEARDRELVNGPSLWMMDWSLRRGLCVLRDEVRNWFRRVFLLSKWRNEWIENSNGNEGVGDEVKMLSEQWHENGVSTLVVAMRCESAPPPRGFHLAYQCVASRVKSKWWPLGVKQLLDNISKGFNSDPHSQF